MIKINNPAVVDRIVQSLLALDSIKNYTNKLTDCCIEALIESTDNLEYELLKNLSLALGRKNCEPYTFTFTNTYLIVYSYDPNIDDDLKELYKIKNKRA